ncbi:MAG: hypothetical protein O7F75_04670 [Alphaproteobacteria bacterium]|nr:hypothetical protein [Alphaproteobacteria bacterium]
MPARAGAPERQAEVRPHPAAAALSDAALDALPDVSLRVPSYLAKAYRTLALVSHPRHLEGLALGDGDTLAITDDWLMWRQCADRGMHCVHFETGLLDWEDQKAPKTDLFCFANEWVYVDGRDVTLFRGVSLGKQFTKEAMRVYLAYRRITSALEWFCRTYKPERLLLFDCRVEDFDLNDHAKRIMVEEVARANGVAVEDRLGIALPADTDDSRTPTLTRVGGHTLGVRSFLRALYVLVVDCIFRLRFIVRRASAKRILVFPVGAMQKGLLHSFDRVRVRPVFPAERMPKGPGFLWFCLRRGISLVSLGGERRLSGNDERALRAIVDTLEKAWSAPVRGFDRVLRAYLRHEVIAAGRLHAMARQVNGAHAFFKRNPGLHRIVSSGCALNPETRIYVEIGRNMGVPADGILHGMRFSRFTYDTLCGDRFGKPILSRFLALGSQNQNWLKSIGSPIASVCTGHPGYGTFSRAAAVPAGKDAKILFLPCMTEEEDYTVFTADCHEDLVHKLKALQHLGYRNIVTKLHPGTQNVAYYKKIFAYFDLPGRLAHGGNFPAHVDWADLVIGPVWSSSLLEVTAAGKPYLPVLLPRSIADANLLKPFKLIRTMADFRSAMENGLDQDRDAILEACFSHPRIPDPAARIWQILAEDLPSGGDLASPRRAPAAAAMTTP